MDIVGGNSNYNGRWLVEHNYCVWLLLINRFHKLYVTASKSVNSVIVTNFLKFLFLLVLLGINGCGVLWKPVQMSCSMCLFSVCMLYAYVSANATHFLYNFWFNFNCFTWSLFSFLIWNDRMHKTIASWPSKAIVDLFVDLKTIIGWNKLMRWKSLKEFWFSYRQSTHLIFG